MSTIKLVRRLGQAGVVLTTAGLAVLLGGGIASAHVTARVIGEDAAQGGYTKITFRVPNEDDTAGTTKLEVRFPQDTPISSLRTKPMPGWTAQVVMGKLAAPVKSGDTEITEAVTSVSWTAGPGVRIGPGEFAEFEVSGGPLPRNADKLIMPTAQTYDNGKVVDWNAPPPAKGAEEPEHPAPMIALAPAGAGDGDHAAPAAGPAPDGAQASGSGTAGTTNTAAAAGTTDTTARWLGGIGLVVGALGLGFGAGATLRARRVTAAASEARAGDGS
jgi:uncharacterized protein YcnI